MAQDMTLHDVDHMSNEAEHAAEVEGVPAGAFNRRLANLLQAQRAHHDLTFREVARRSQGRFTPRDLKAAEAGTLSVDEGTAVELAALYAVDLGEILGDRLPVEVDEAGLVRTGGVVETFDPADDDSLLNAYLVLVRRLRRQERADAVDLRRDDVLALASHLGVPGATVVERLGALMGATRSRRTSMAALFGAGVAVIGLTTGVAAVATSGGDSPSEVPAPVATVVTTLAPEDIAPATSAPPAEPAEVVVPTTTPSRDDAHVPPNIVDTPAPVPTSVAEEPSSPVATNPPPATSPPATPTPTAPPPTAPPATDPPDQVGLPPVPPETSPPPVDTLPPGTPVVVDPPPPVVPPDDAVSG